MIKVVEAASQGDLQKCVNVILELRPNHTPATLIAALFEMKQEGYRLLFVEEDGRAVAALGFRYLQFLHNGKHFYIDDLSTLPSHRGKGYGTALLQHVFGLAKAEGYKVVTLDSGPQRHDAHRLYLNQGFQIASYHFSKKL